MNARWLTTVVAVASGACAAADGGAESPENYFGEFPVVLSASRLLQTSDEAPASVTVIDREMIKASGARELVDLFRLVPGMVVGGYNAHQPTIGYFGFLGPYFQQLQVLVDGVSIYSPIWGGADWNQLSITLEDIERIEVVRGPNASTFGANSFLGVVNIITRDPAVERGTEAFANVGENGIEDASVRHAVNEGDLRYRFTAGHRADRGLNAYPDSLRSNFLNMRGHYRVNGSDELRLQADYLGGTQVNGVYSEPNHTDGPRTAQIDRGSMQLRWTRMAGAEEELWVQLSHSENVHRETVPYILTLPAPFGTWNYPLSYDYDTRRTDLEMQHTTRLTSALRGVWGAQLRDEGARSRTYFATDDWVNSHLSRLFGNLEWRPAADWIVATGAMFEDNSLTGRSVSPSLAVNYRFMPDQTVRLRMANGRRTPTLYEDRFDWRYELPPAVKDALTAMGSPLATLPLVQSALAQGDLDDEKIRSRELSYMALFPDQHFNFELGFFEHKLNGLIHNFRFAYPSVEGTLDPSHYALVWGYANRDSACIKGQAVQARWQPRPGSLLYLSGSRGTIKAEGPDAPSLEESAPLHTASLLVSQDLPGAWVASLGYYWVGPVRPNSSGDALPATERVNLRLGKRFSLWGARAEAAVVMQQATGDVPVFKLKTIDHRTTWLNMRLEY